MKIIFLGRYLFVIFITLFLISNFILLKFRLKILSNLFIYLTHVLGFWILTQEIGFLKSFGLGFTSLIFFCCCLYKYKKNTDG